MKRKIALLSDIHGNVTALEAVLADAKKEQVTDYWFLGDLLAPGTGRKKIIDLMAALPISLQVRGNWEDSIWNALHGKLDISRPSHLYMVCLCQYLLEEVTPEELNRLHELPLQLLTKVGDLEIIICQIKIGDESWFILVNKRILIACLKVTIVPLPFMVIFISNFFVMRRGDR